MCKNLPFMVGLDVGGRTETACAFRDHQLKGWCDTCLAEARKSHQDGEPAEDALEGADEDSDDADEKSMDSGETEMHSAGAHTTVPTYVISDDDVQRAEEDHEDGLEASQA